MLHRLFSTRYTLLQVHSSGFELEDALWRKFYLGMAIRVRQSRGHVGDLVSLH